ncbi:MAG: tRNA pseudouridine(54/55) synthase Pus10 [Candidatus Aenigmarchaeota archaeon]|nr:tRNA pseudouridine(54/55) synthase Pus10 [Candidatus Aenigmarchaeota archaeon]
MISETAREILQKGYVCDNCLGRQFGQILSGMTNRERGHAIRTALALEYAVKPFPTEKSNFLGFNFRKVKPETKKEKEQCKICGGLFDSLGKWADEAVKKLRPLEYRTFLVSSSMSRILIRNEENLWEDIGIEYCEPMKSELNRELGKLVAEKTGKNPDEKSPDITIMLDLEKNLLSVNVNPLFIYGRYQKLVRGIPQTKWEMYKETVEDIIAKPFMRESEGKAHSMHAAGREDIDARCLDWRPFVLEIESPRKRILPLRKMEAEINRTKKVKVSELSYSDRKEVVTVKSLMPDKTYRVLASFGKPVTESELRKLKSISMVRQQTPTRVAHRRADMTRAKKVKSLSWRILPKNRAEFMIRGEAGLYIKELLSGDNGRTRPSFSSVLETPVRTEELDVVKIHLPAGSSRAK